MSTRVLAAAVLLGVLAMTWFAPQRMAHADGAGTAPHVATAAHGEVGHPHGDAAHDHALDEHDDQHHSHALDVLLGFLAALLATLLVSLWSRLPRRPMVVLRRVRFRLLVLSRPPDPPCLNRLSIRIC